MPYVRFEAGPGVGVGVGVGGVGVGGGAGPGGAGRKKTNPSKKYRHLGWVIKFRLPAKSPPMAVHSRFQKVVDSSPKQNRFILEDVLAFE